MFEILEAICRPGNPEKPNEDSYGVAENTVWVIDGATVQAPSLVAGEGETDASWLAGRLSGALKEKSRGYGRDLAGLLVNVQQETRQELQDMVGELPADKADLPSCAVTLLHFGDDGNLYVAGLSDTMIILAGPSGTAGWYGDPLHHRIDQDMLEVFKEHQSSGIYNHNELRQMVMPLIREQRRSANMPGFFGVFDLVSDFSGHIVSKSWPAGEYSHGLLMSDGFAALSDKYGRYSYDGLIRSACGEGLESLYGELRQVEEADPDCTKKPRFKKSDDATAVLLKL